MPALTATVHNKSIKALYKRIVEKNPAIKRKGVVAGMRKLLVLIFVLWKKNEVYQENYQWNGKVEALTSGNDETKSLHLVKKKRDKNCPARDRLRYNESTSAFIWLRQRYKF
jgi:hypothetical protein